MLALAASHHLIAALLSLLLSATPAANKSPKLSPDEAIKRWADGPVRYLMTTREYDAVREIKSVPELSRYITKFWLRRDPTPGTFENEYRRAYWGRVLDANRRFRDSTTPGWKTDRGKVYIMLGEPDDIQRDQAPKTQGSLGGVTKAQIDDPDKRGLERWTYHRGQSKVVKSEYVVAFVLDESMEYKLTTDPSLLQPQFPGSSTGDANDAAFGGIENSGASASAVPSVGTPSGPGVLSALSSDPMQPDTSLLANYDLGLEMAAVPSNVETVIATVSTKEFLSGFKATPRFEYFRAQDGSTFVNVGALVQAKDLYGNATSGVSSLRLYASIVPTTEPAQAHYVTNEAQPVQFDLHEGPPPGGLVEVWTGRALPPGHYHLTVAVEDSLTGRLGRAAGEFEAPNFAAPGLSLSTLILSAEISDSGGRLGVTSRSSAVFSKSESFGVYYEVYGLKEATSLFEVSYRFYHEDNGTAVPIGKPVVFPDRNQGVQAWSFPLTKWPAARYRLEVTVTDPSGESISTLAPFEVVE